MAAQLALYQAVVDTVDETEDYQEREGDGAGQGDPAILPFREHERVQEINMGFFQLVRETVYKEKGVSNIIIQYHNHTPNILLSQTVILYYFLTYSYTVIFCTYISYLNCQK